MTVKLRAEYFWADRWLSSSAALLPIEMRGLYREMLTIAWSLGASLPNDHDAIKRAVRCTDDEWNRCWPMVRRFWHEVDGRLVNDVQREVYEKQLQAHERASVAAQRRWQRQVKASLHGDTHPDPQAKPNGETHQKTHRSLHMRSGSGSGSGSEGQDTNHRARARKNR